MNSTPRIIFFGTPAFSVIVLSKLIKAYLKPIAVVTSPARPAGRGRVITDPILALYAREHTIPLLQPENTKDIIFLDGIRALKPDVCAIASYGHILPKELLSIPPHGFINVHPSLLPIHRGPSPIQTTILQGDTKTGVTLMLTDEKMDHGPILAQQKLEYMNSRPTYQELHDALAELGGTLLAHTLPAWVAGNITPKEQNHTQATYTKLFTKEDGHIDWTKPALEIGRMVRALNPWPGTWSMFGSPTSDSKRVKILSGYALDEKINLVPGTITKTENGGLAVATGEGLFALEMLQEEGGSPSKGEDINARFLSGAFFYTPQQSV